MRKVQLRDFPVELVSQQCEFSRHLERSKCKNISYKRELYHKKERRFIMNVINHGKLVKINQKYIEIYQKYIRNIYIYICIYLYNIIVIIKIINIYH